MPSEGSCQPVLERHVRLGPVEAGLASDVQYVLVSGPRLQQFREFGEHRPEMRIRQHEAVVLVVQHETLRHQLDGIHQQMMRRFGGVLGLFALGDVLYDSEYADHLAFGVASAICLHANPSSCSIRSNPPELVNQFGVSPP